MARTSVVREGFSLVEVLVALALVSTVALGLAAAIGKLSSGAARDGQVLRGAELARERIVRVTSDPAYASLEARYTAVEPAATLGGFTRTTTIQRVLENQPSGRTLDYKVVDVVVAGPGLEAPVRRRAVVAAP